MMFLKLQKKLLKKLNYADSLSQVDEEISSMEEIFELQKMFEIHSQEKDIEQKLKNMGYITIPYLDNNGIWRNYIPDFFVKVTDNEYCIIETKGAELINDPNKKNALEKKLEDINKVQNKIKFSSLYVLYDDFNRLENKPSTFKKFYEIFKKTM